MKSYFHDDLPGDQRDPHDSGVAVSESHLNELGVQYYKCPSIEDVNKIASARGYVNRDEVTIKPESFPSVEAYEAKLKVFYAEHLHEDEEIRYILEGEGYFDVREKGDSKWIRIQIEKDDLLIVPAGIYHRFTLTSTNYTKAMRLFQEEPKWVPHNRPDADTNPIRQQYLQNYIKA